MKLTPGLKKVKTIEDMKTFAEAYQKCSGLSVPINYLYQRQSFQISWKGKMIGGFVLAHGSAFRTLHLFANEEKHPELISELNNFEEVTELSCLWIDPEYRKQFLFSFLIWNRVAEAIKKYSKPNLIFGTKREKLAQLFGLPKRSKLLHSDFKNVPGKVSDQRTWIFSGKAKDIDSGVRTILLHKIKNNINPLRKRISPNPVERINDLPAQNHLNNLSIY